MKSYGIIGFKVKKKELQDLTDEENRGQVGMSSKKPHP